MEQDEVEAKLHTITTGLINELISLTPESMSEIQFEIVATGDGGADIGLLDHHPDATMVSLSENVYAFASHYLPLVKQLVPGWKRSLMIARESDDGWQISVDFETE